METVLGPVSPERLGSVLIHEHLLWDLRVYQHRPADLHPVEARFATRRVTPTSSWWSREHVFGNPDNLVQRSTALATAEASRFADLGGGTIVDATGRGIGRRPGTLRRTAAATGLNIVMGCGYYIATSHPPGLARRSEASIAAEMRREITSGIGRTSIRAGVIGEIGTSHPIHDRERRVLAAAAHVHRETAIPLIVHPGPSPDALHGVADALVQLGADPAGCLISHVDARALPDRGATVVELALRGFNVGIDTFGRESWYEPRGVQLPSDAQRVELIDALARAGHLGSTFLSHDICFKSELTRFGGHGYGHILRTIVPRLRMLGLGDAEVRQLLVGNPARLLSGAWSDEG